MFIYTVQINTFALHWSWEDVISSHIKLLHLQFKITVRGPVNTYITELQVTATDVDNETLVQKKAVIFNTKYTAANRKWQVLKYVT